MSFTCTGQETTAWETVDSPPIWGYAMLLPPMKADMPSDCISARSARMCESGFRCAILASSGCQLPCGRQTLPWDCVRFARHPLRIRVRRTVPFAVREAC
jgi:hypothetical protein